ncbi:MAG: hypothetical protein EBU84_18140 [Actinobacteria bacterium]|nr:hypothetical protein [Actinomycetota bacterium]
MTNFYSRLEPLELALAGKTYEMSYTVALTGNQTTYFQMKSNNKPTMLVHFEVSSSAEPLKVTLLEAPTMTDGTTAVTAYNMKRDSLNTPTLLFYSNPTFTSGGTPINIHIVTAGKGGGAITAESGVWVLKTSTNYLIKVEQLTNQATTVAYNAVFSEDYAQF